MDKVQSTLKQFVRDWSAEGEAERNACYLPIINEIVHRFPPDKWYVNFKFNVLFLFLKFWSHDCCFSNPEDINILVPGAGLGRLAFELALKGYSCQGNEFSLFMIFASNFVLNK